jgi:cytochrome c-type biogenesis protein CcmE
MSTARQRRLWMVLGIVAGAAVATGLALQAMKNSIGYRDPTTVLEQHIPPGKRFQLGGMVQEGSVRRTPGSLTVNFIVTDFRNQIPVRYDRVLPDLFKEKAGVTANGRLDASGVFVADEVLAKHDENYMPSAVSKSLQKGQSRSDTGAAPAAQP